MRPKKKKKRLVALEEILNRQMFNNITKKGQSFEWKSDEYGDKKNAL